MNLTRDSIVFAVSGVALNEAIRRSVREASKALLDRHGLTSSDLANVSTKTNPHVAYSKFSHYITECDDLLGEEYVETCFRYYSCNGKVLEKQEFLKILFLPLGEFRESFLSKIRRGLGLFLLSLHCRQIITLPMSFTWPIRLVHEKNSSNKIECFSELLSFIRELNPESDELPHQAFLTVANDRKRREYFLTYATKILLATGWQVPEDARLSALQAIKASESDLDAATEVLAYLPLIQVLSARFGERFPITVSDWVLKIQPLEASVWASSNYQDQPIENSAPADIFAAALKVLPSQAKPDILRRYKKLPGLDLDVSQLAGTWFDLQDAYVKEVRRESYKQTKMALNYLNIYLVFYLPYWFHQNQQSELKFPHSPAQMPTSIFLHRLTPLKIPVPKTFLEFLNAVASTREWTNESLYGTLKQVEKFFQFLSDYSDQLPGCTGFKQPLTALAYPPVTRSQGTPKDSIPRKIFGFLLDYVDTLRVYSDVVTERILEGRFDVNAFESANSRIDNLIDTVQNMNRVGFVPIRFTDAGAVPIKLIPNLLSMDWFELKDKRRIKIPQPHALNQIYVSLCTGLRHNHIQWLDARTFDALVTPTDREFSKLLVNTDKAKTTTWSPSVNFKVIEVLRDQLRWRDRIGWKGFQDLIYYNNEPQTKWPPILPLFSCDLVGRPHNDSRYTNAWRSIILAVDGHYSDLNMGPLRRLCSLGPPGLDVNATFQEKAKRFGESKELVCELLVKGNASPHSSRVTVVTQYSTILPLDMVGKHITGQTEAVAYHYVKLDSDEVEAAQVRQAMAIREKSYRNISESLFDGQKGSPVFIKADEINSNFSKSLRKNLNETLVSYGCISITLNEDATSGLDVMRETFGRNAAENKTEVCPYGNQCPPEVIKRWRGSHRCSLCEYAVRSVDHLPAISARVRCEAENLDAVTIKIEKSIDAGKSKFTEAELDRLDQERGRIAEELVGWKLAEEVLYGVWTRIASGEDNRRWVVEKPEIIIKDLKRVSSPTNLTEYVLRRLDECIAYPALENPHIRAKFDILRRELLARSGKVREAFSMDSIANPAAECAGLIKTIVAANGLTYDDLVKIISDPDDFSGLQGRQTLLLENPVLADEEE